ncbi:organic cation transporter protein-like [Antedon mediterranea]|uniref:organic cation transporter protein-like n=1 Tax=Antedon mediterranea TaxID=105859 RepID=UPI003AF4B70C
MDVDETLRALHPWGRYQIVLLIVNCVFGTMTPALHIFSLIYIMDTPIHHCNPYEGYSTSQAIPVSKVHSKEIVEYESCLIYQMDNGGTLTNQTISCPDGNEYILSEGESTVVNELGLVCDKKLMANTAMSVYFCGVLVGAIVSGITSDYFGRRNVFLTATILIGITGIGLIFTTSYYTFVFVWFITAIEEQCVNVPSYVLLMEMFPPEKRTLAGCISNLAWGIGIALLSVYAYFLRDWRHMQIAISAPCFAAVFFWWFVYESPRWMISKGRFTEANIIFQKIAKFNKLEQRKTYINNKHNGEAVREMEDLNGKHEKTKTQMTSLNKLMHCFTRKENRPIETKRKNTFLDILKSPRMRRSTLIAYYIFLVNSLFFVGISLNSSDLFGDKYLNTFLVCLVDVPSGIVSIYLLQRINRRPLLMIFLLLAAVFSISSAFVPLVTKSGTNLYPLILTLACLGKYAIGTSFNCFWLYANEIFPTELRNRAFGTCSFAARIGSIIAPYILYLNNFYAGSALLLFGIFAAVGGILVYFLPETRNKPLPENMEEGEDLHAGRKIIRP